MIIQPENMVPLTSELKEQLVCWTDIIRSTHPGSLSHMRFDAKFRIEQAVHDFLSQRLLWKDIGFCYEDIPNKRVIAVPEDWADQFADWFAARIDAGLLDPVKIVKRQRPTLRLEVRLF